MIETLKYSSVYKSLNLAKSIHHAYLFYSLDKELNNNIALLFAKSLVCDNNNACGECFGCKQFESASHPDVVKIEQATIKVEDANNIINKLNTKPISNKIKVFIILNAENINEIAQNKLLKSLEEPNPSNVFILTTSKTDKLLPTIMSRLHKINVPKLTVEDKKLISKELENQNVNIANYINTTLNLTDILNFESNENYKNTLNAISYLFNNLKSSQDIPRVANSLPTFDKTLFLPLLQKTLLSCVGNEKNFNDELVNLINSNYSKKALIKCLKLVEDSYKKQMSNVNFSYILDNLLFNILKEKFLCK